MKRDPLASRNGATLPAAIWYTRCPVPTAAGLAIQKGWLNEAFAPDGIEVRSVRHSQDPKIRESHYTHTLDNAFRQGGNAPALFARSEGKDTVLLGLHYIPHYQAILSLPGSGLTSASQLKGRRLALPRRLKDPIDFWRATALQGYENILRLANLSLSDVELVDLPIEQAYVDEDDVEITHSVTSASRTIKLHTREMTALLRGEVDAMFGYSIWGAAVRGQISAVEVFPFPGRPMEDQINNDGPEALTVSGGLLRNHPELVERYLMKLIAAADWAKRNKAAARSGIALEMGSAEYWLDKGCGPDVADRLDFTLDDTLVRALDVRKAFLLQHGFMRKDFDLRDWIDPRPLQSATKRLASQHGVAHERQRHQ